MSITYAREKDLGVVKFVVLFGASQREFGEVIKICPAQSASLPTSISRIGETWLRQPAFCCKISDLRLFAENSKGCAYRVIISSIRSFSCREFFIVQMIARRFFQQISYFAFILALLENLDLSSSIFASYFSCKIEWSILFTQQICTTIFYNSPVFAFRSLFFKNSCAWSEVKFGSRGIVRLLPRNRAWFENAPIFGKIKINLILFI